jgi:peptidoglycan/LPS O-acetylase OafA/YrhL
MYLLHMLALNVARRVVPAQQFSPVATFLATLALTVVAAGFAYRFYELPFLRLKQRFSTARASFPEPPSADRESARRAGPCLPTPLTTAMTEAARA